MDKSLKNGAYLAFGLFFVSFTLNACQKPQPTVPNAQQPDIFAPVVDEVVAKVGGEDILYSEVRAAAVILGLIETGEALSKPTPVSIAPMDAADFNTALDSLIGRKLLAQDAQRAGIDTSPDAVRRLKAARQRILSSMRVEVLIRETVTEDAMRKLYETQAALADFGDEIRARHIVVESQEDALKVIEQLEGNGDFEALAADLSIDVDTRDRGGDLGYFTFDALALDFVKPVFAGQTGKTLPPFETGKGWHIVEILDRRRPDTKTYEDSRESLRSFLTFDAIQTLMDDLRAQNDVTLIPLTPPNAVSTTGGIDK